MFGDDYFDKCQMLSDWLMGAMIFLATNLINCTHHRIRREHPKITNSTPHQACPSRLPFFAEACHRPHKELILLRRFPQANRSAEVRLRHPLVKLHGCPDRFCCGSSTNRIKKAQLRWPMQRPIETRL